MEPYKLYMVQVLRAGDRAKCLEFGNAILRDIEVDNFFPRLIFIDKATIHISGKVNHHIVQGTRKFIRDLKTSQ